MSGSEGSETAYTDNMTGIEKSQSGNTQFLHPTFSKNASSSFPRFQRIWSHDSETPALLKTPSSVNELEFSKQDRLLQTMKSDDFQVEMFGTIDHEYRNQRWKWIIHVFTHYDWRALFVILLNSFNRGGRTVALLANTIILKYEPYSLGHQERQLITALIFTPFLLLVPMALISESVYLFGNNDKSYIILWSLISIAAALTVAFTLPDSPDPWFLTLMNWLIFFGMAWIDTIVGGIIVKESRRDKDKGAEDMRYFQWLSWSIGGIVPVLIGPYCLFEQHKFNISTLYFVLAGSSCLMLVAAFFIPTDVRTIQRKEENLGFWKYCELQMAGTRQAL
jgi:hypothetical protein